MFLFDSHLIESRHGYTWCSKSTMPYDEERKKKKLGKPSLCYLALSVLCSLKITFLAGYF